MAVPPTLISWGIDRIIAQIFSNNWLLVCVSCSMQLFSAACLCVVCDLGCEEQQLDLLLSISVAKALVQHCANQAFFSFAVLCDFFLRENFRFDVSWAFCTTLNFLLCIHAFWPDCDMLTSEVVSWPAFQAQAHLEATICSSVCRLFSLF